MKQIITDMSFFIIWMCFTLYKSFKKDKIANEVRARFFVTFIFCCVMLVLLNYALYLCDK